MQLRTETISVTINKRRINDEEECIIREGTHEPIISLETFKAVENLLIKRTKEATAPSKHLFSNLIFCEDCGKGMWYKANQKGYRCGGNIRYGERFCSNKTPLRSKDLEQVIANDIKALFQIFKDKSFMARLEYKLNAKKHQIQEKLQIAEKKISTLEKKKHNYVDLFKEEIISNEDLIELRLSVNNEIDEIKSAIIDFKGELTNCSNENYLQSLKNKLEQFLEVEELTPQMLNALVDKITISANGEIRIHYSFENPFETQKEDSNLDG